MRASVSPEENKQRDQIEKWIELYFLLTPEQRHDVTKRFENPTQRLVQYESQVFLNIKT